MLILHQPKVTSKMNHLMTINKLSIPAPEIRGQFANWPAILRNSITVLPALYWTLKKEKVRSMSMYTKCLPNQYKKDLLF